MADPMSAELIQSVILAAHSELCELLATGVQEYEVIFVTNRQTLTTMIINDQAVDAASPYSFSYFVETSVDAKPNCIATLFGIPIKFLDDSSDILCLRPVFLVTPYNSVKINALRDGALISVSGSLYEYNQNPSRASYAGCKIYDTPQKGERHMNYVLGNGPTTWSTSAVRYVPTTTSSTTINPDAYVTITTTASGSHTYRAIPITLEEPFEDFEVSNELNEYIESLGGEL